MRSHQFDAVVIGAGPNGLVAANQLADHGWSVVVVEAEHEPGGAVRSDRSLEPEFVTDRFSAFYPLAVASPHIRRLRLDEHGLEWTHAPTVLAHPTPDGPTAVLSRDLDVTAASLEQFAAGDGDRWRDLQREWADVEDELIAALMAPFPPVRGAWRLLRRQGLAGTAELARRAAMPVRRLAAERFDGAGAGLLLAGSALHADVTPDSVLSGLLGWLLTGIAQQRGWPVPVGGAGELAAAMARRFDALGGVLVCDQRVVEILVDDSGACGVRTESGERYTARHGVLADVVAPKLYHDLLASDAVPASLSAKLRRYQPGSATFKVNWTLDAGVPWIDPAVAGAGTVHLADSMDELSLNAAQLAVGRLPKRPFMLLGQMTTADPTRSPRGTESLWAYTDVPQQIRGDEADQLGGLDDPDDIDAFAARLEDRIEDSAPGFRSLVRRRSIQSPRDLEQADANLINGDKNLGSAQLHQQLIFRPTLGLGRAETPIPKLFLASASAHPGGGVHGACGANAARAAIAARSGGIVMRWPRVRHWRRTTGIDPSRRPRPDEFRSAAAD